MYQLTRLALLGMLLAGAAACAHVQAATPPPSVLDVPDPPLRVVVPPTADISEPPPPVTPPAPTPAAPNRPTNTAAPTRPAERPTVTPPPTTTPVPPEAAAPPLETTADVSGLAEQTNVLLGNATRDLNRVDFVALSVEAKAQYQRAKGFVTQAQNALKEKNLTYARNMAEKAAALASQLPKTR